MPFHPLALLTWDVPMPPGKELAHIIYFGLKTRHSFCIANGLDPKLADWDAGVNGRLWLHYQFGTDDCLFDDTRGRSWLIPATVCWKCSGRKFPGNACHIRTADGNDDLLSCDLSSPSPPLSAPVASPEWAPIKSFTESHQDIFARASSEKAGLLGPAALRLVESSRGAARWSELLSGHR